ncbi:hypothetical protein FOZ63_010536 [Perkinsus olseni]|uniref:Uncharacterized protein n=1 Tax=Perkinsus olseni TaxID=32597 RepID=A0A7J6U6Z3_PEROL|nr:hypothetical protein FOZ63_010536 [Perkinsus olseni]KAF4753188.1 hypothetical protein FOZ62_023231 [Perkinsus olseni]
MMRTSVDPNQILEAPSEPPPPGLYLNNGSIPDPYLSDVLLTYADEGWSIRFTFWDNSTVSFQAQAYRRDPGRRCFWLGESVDRRLLFRRTPIPKQHMLSFIRASDVGICQTLESRLYLVLETLTIPLKPATVEPEEPSDTAESSVDAPSAAKRQRSSSESDAIDSPTVKRLGRRSTNTKELEGVNGQATEGDGSLTTASVVGTGRTQSDELAQLESSQGGVPSKLQEPSYAPAPSTHPAPEKKDADEATAVPGESFDNTMGQLEPRLDEETLDWLTENEEDLLRWVEEGI